MTTEMQIFQLALASTSKRLNKVLRQIVRPDWTWTRPEGLKFHAQAIIQIRGSLGLYDVFV
jgi:hypothetical protein